MVLLHHGGEFFGRRQIGPTLKQFAFAAQNQNLKRSRADWNPKLRRNAPIEIRDSEDVASRIVRDIFGGVTGLKLFRFRVQAASDQCIHDARMGAWCFFSKRKFVIIRNSELPRQYSGTRSPTVLACRHPPMMRPQ